VFLVCGNLAVQREGIQSAKKKKCGAVRTGPVMEETPPWTTEGTGLTRKEWPKRLDNGDAAGNKRAGTHEQNRSSFMNMKGRRIQHHTGGHIAAGGLCQQKARSSKIEGGGGVADAGEKARLSLFQVGYISMAAGKYGHPGTPYFPL